MTSSLDLLIEDYKQSINQHLASLLPQSDTRLNQAMRYSTLNGGKRLRPLLTTAICHDSKTKDDYMSAACAIELIHCYSLIHDDLPCMDNAMLRRNRPTCHMQFDEATALLAGNALCTLAFEAITRTSSTRTPQQTQMLINTLAKACGSDGLMGGQSLDIYHTNNSKITLNQLEDMHQRKTGALFSTSISFGITLSPLTENDKQQLTHYGSLLGKAFQMADDILDYTATQEQTGKDALQDTEKNTYITVLGLEATQNQLKHLFEELFAALDAANTPFPMLKAITNQFYNAHIKHYHSYKNKNLKTPKASSLTQAEIL